MIFQLSCAGYESFSHWLFERDGTQEEFQKDCDDLIVKYGDEYIERTDGWVGSMEWVEFVATKLTERGYKPVVPVCVGYSEEMILGSDDRDSAWAELIGERLMDKAIKHNFAASFYKDDDIYFVDGLYHTRDCPVLSEMWREHRGWSFKWDCLDKITCKTPCDICKPQKP